MDVLHMFEDPKYSDFFRQPRGVALCFKYANCSDPAWTSFTTNWFNNAQRIIQQKELGILLVMDGAITPTHAHCFDNKFTSLPATYIPFEDPTAGGVRNTTAHGYDRYLVLNMPALPHPFKPEAALKFMQKVNYEKFITSEYPYLFWEPSAQDEILAVVKQYKRAVLHKPGFRFAINIDPVQFTVYSAQQTGVGSNLVLDRHGPLGTTQPPFTFEYDGLLFTMYTKQKKMANTKKSTATLVYAVYQLQQETMTNTSAPQTSGQFKQTYYDVAVPGSAIWATSMEGVIGWVNGGSFVLGLNSNGKYITWLVGSGGGITLLSSGALSTANKPWNCGCGGCHLSMSCSPSKNAIRCLLLLTACDVHNAKQLYSYTLQVGGKGKLTFQLKGTKSLGSSATVIKHSVLSTKSTETGCNYVAVFSTQTANKRINGGYACINKQGMVSKVAMTDIGVGVNSSLSLFNAYPTGKAMPVPTVFEIHSDGYCDNAEVYNKQANVKCCDNAVKNAVATPQVLNYNYGTLADWMELINKKAGPVTSCSTTMMHGMYDMGSNPAAIAFWKDSTAVCVSMHGGYTAASNAGATICGVAVNSTGKAVLDGWTLPLIPYP
eukprot:TRINITY_DN54368_c0_g2_i1.p1 TRINITY_DN54368_c0_g2~~TRINITY_DN54368_c0_g2_i1.p1  ORF type:complete len:700 (-),score=69.45 TRINITY_DN54368_c0_g2_i1:880-2691(-)